MAAAAPSRSCLGSDPRHLLEQRANDVESLPSHANVASAKIRLFSREIAYSDRRYYLELHTSSPDAELAVID
jgi:hypothetical protein